MKVILLGTGSPLPDPNRAGPATLVQAGSANLLVDCGRGVSMRLAAAGVHAPGLSALLITHLHSDHITDLNDLMTCRWIMGPTSVPLLIYGPPGTQRVVDAVHAFLTPDTKYRVDHHADLRDGPGMRAEVTEVAPGDRFAVGDANVSVHRTDHRPVVPTVGYRVEHEGSVVALAGDTVPCPELDEMCAGADVYVQTVIRDDMVRFVANLRPEVSGRFLDIIDYHSTVAQAAQTAARAGVKKLVLTHYVPPPIPGTEDQWIALAAEHFAGEIIMGPDLTAVTA